MKGPILLEVTKPFKLPENNGCCHAGYYAVAAKVKYGDYIANEIHVSKEPIHFGPFVEYKDIPLNLHISDHANQMAEHILDLSKRLGEAAAAFHVVDR